MALITSKTEELIDLTAISRGALIQAKEATWTTAKNGIVTAATAEKLIVISLADAGSMMNYFEILASEAAAGNWVIKWTNDMVTINSYGETS
jgi:hypothetical protein